MQVHLTTEVAGGDGPDIECCEYFAEDRHVSWDERSPLKTDLTLLLKNALFHAEQTTGAPMVLHQLSLQAVGPIHGVRYYYFTTYYQHCDGDGEPVSAVFDLRGQFAESKKRTFKDENAYARYLEKKHGRG